MAADRPPRVYPYLAMDFDAFLQLMDIVGDRQPHQKHAWSGSILGVPFTHNTDNSYLFADPTTSELRHFCRGDWLTFERDHIDVTTPCEYVDECN